LVASAAPVTGSEKLTKISDSSVILSPPEGCDVQVGGVLSPVYDRVFPDRGFPTWSVTSLIVTIMGPSPGVPLNARRYEFPPMPDTPEMDNVPIPAPLSRYEPLFSAPSTGLENVTSTWLRALTRDPEPGSAVTVGFSESTMKNMVSPLRGFPALSVTSRRERNNTPFPGVPSRSSV